MPNHPTAIIASGADVDESVDIGPYCVIDKDVQIEANVRLYHNVYLTGCTRIAADCVLHPGVIVGHEPQDIKYSGARSFCRVGSRTILREYVTIHRGTEPDSETVIGEDCFFLAGAHVGHNCRIGNRVTLVNGAKLAGHVAVGDGAIVSGGVAVHQFVRIGDLAMVTGNARVSMDVVPFALVDFAGRIAGLNRIGLRRAGVPPEEVRGIREAYRVLFARRVPFRQAIESLAQLEPTPSVRRIVDFLREPSRRSLAGRSRVTGSEPTADESPE